jgi:hypothetical protein
LHHDQKSRILHNRSSSGRLHNFRSKITLRDVNRRFSYFSA